MSDQGFVQEGAEASEHAEQDAAETARYQEAEKRFETSESGEGQEADGGEGAAEKAEPNPWEAKFRDQQKAMKAERKKRQEMEQRLADMEAKASGNQTAQPFEIPDPNEDPIAAIEAMRALISKFDEDERKSREEEGKQRQVSQREQGLAQTLAESEADFRRLKPDYDKAAEHLKRARIEELKETGIPDREIPTILRREFLEVIERAEASDKDPAEVVYALAMRRGYSLASASQKMQDIANGQKAGQSLSKVGGRNGNGSDMTVARASNMKGKDLLAAYAKLRDQAKREGAYR